MSISVDFSGINNDVHGTHVSYNITLLFHKTGKNINSTGSVTLGYARPFISGVRLDPCFAYYKEVN